MHLAFWQIFCGSSLAPCTCARKAWKTCVMSLPSSTISCVTEREPFWTARLLALLDKMCPCFPIPQTSITSTLMQEDILGGMLVLFEIGSWSPSTPRGRLRALVSLKRLRRTTLASLSRCLVPSKPPRTTLASLSRSLVPSKPPRTTLASLSRCLVPSKPPRTSATQETEQTKRLRPSEEYFAKHGAKQPTVQPPRSNPLTKASIKKL